MVDTVGTSVANQLGQTGASLLRGIFDQVDSPAEGAIEGNIRDLLREGHIDQAQVLLREYIQSEISTELEQMIQMLGPQQSEALIKAFAEDSDAIFTAYLDQETARSTDIRTRSTRHADNLINLWNRQGEMSLDVYEGIAGSKTLLAQLGVFVKAIAATGLLDIPPEVVVLADQWISDAEEYATELRENEELVNTSQRDFAGMVAETTIDPETLMGDAREVATGGMAMTSALVEELDRLRTNIWGDSAELRAGTTAPAAPAPRAEPAFVLE